MAYTYIIGWSKHNKYYYGVRFAKNAHPSELWSKYFTSSKHVKKFREIHGEPDIVEVRREFDEISKARLWETKVLKRINAANNSKWLNQTDNQSINPEAALRGTIKANSQRVQSKETKNRISKALTGKKLKGDTRKKISLWYQNLTEEEKRELNSKKGRSRLGSSNGMYGKKHSEETKAKLRRKKNGMLGKKHSEETKAKIRKAALERGK